MKNTLIGQCLTTLLIFVLSTVVAKASSADLTILAPEQSSDIDKIIELDWRKVTTNMDYKLVDKSGNAIVVDKNSLVYLKVKHFNYLHYQPDIVVSEGKIEAASFLIALWEQLLNPKLSKIRGLGALAKKDDPVCSSYNSEASIDQNERRWIINLIEVQDRIDNLVSDQNIAQSSALSEGHISRISLVLDQIIECWVITEVYEKKMLKDLGNSNSDYKLHLEQHQIVKKLVNQFQVLSKKSISGQLELLGKYEAGTAVEILVQAKHTSTGQIQLDEEKASIRFLTQGSIPLRFHSGLTFSALKDTDFETIQNLRGSEFQTRVVEGDETIGLSLFASYPLDGKLDNAKLFATLGTDITDVGDTIYAGLSYKFTEQWFISGGFAYGDTVETDMIPANAMDMESVQEADVFQIIRQDRAAEPFIAISYVFF